MISSLWDLKLSEGSLAVFVKLRVAACSVWLHVAEPLHTAVSAEATMELTRLRAGLS